MTLNANENFERGPHLPGLTLGGLIEAYQTDVASSYHKLRFHVRKNHEGILRRLTEQRGSTPLSEIRARTVKIWYSEWSATGKFAMAHSFIAQLRTLFGFGLTMVEDPECERLCMIMHKLKFSQPEPRITWLSADQADAIRAAAHRRGWGSIALAQAFQFEVMLRQKDVIGEMVPLNEPGESDVVWRGQKWLRGLRWSEIDDNLILRHMTSKRQKFIEVDLKLSPMVLDEMKRIVYRSADGPVILNELTGMPWSPAEFRRKWRILANMAGIPNDVRSMDSRAGAITEATEAGAELEHVKHAALHSDIGMTQRYSRNPVGKIAGVQVKRNEHRLNRS